MIYMFMLYWPHFYVVYFKGGMYKKYTQTKIILDFQWIWSKMHSLDFYFFTKILRIMKGKFFVSFKE